MFKPESVPCTLRQQKDLTPGSTNQLNRGTRHWTGLAGGAPCLADVVTLVRGIGWKIKTVEETTQLGGGGVRYSNPDR